MTEIQKEEILNQIRKQHGIALESKDPIFAVITANEIILNTYIKEIEQKLIQHKIEIETITEQYLNRAKELAEEKLSLATHQAQQRIIQTHKEIEAGQQQTKPYTPPLPLLYTVAGAIGGYALALILL